MKPTKGPKSVGRFGLELEIANFEDLSLARRGMLPPDQVRRQKVQGLVDCGAAMLVLPQTLVKQLGLLPGDRIQVRYADGRQAQRQKAEAAYVELLGRHDTFTAIVEPKRKSALIGAIVLEALDLLVDCQHERLIPRDPHGPIYEIE